MAQCEHNSYCASDVPNPRHNHQRPHLRPQQPWVLPPWTVELLPGCPRLRSSRVDRAAELSVSFQGRGITLPFQRGRGSWLPCPHETIQPQSLLTEDPVDNTQRRLIRRLLSEKLPSQWPFRDCPVPSTCSPQATGEPPALGSRVSWTLGVSILIYKMDTGRTS